MKMDEGLEAALSRKRKQGEQGRNKGVGVGGERMFPLRLDAADAVIAGQEVISRSTKGREGRCVRESIKHSARGKKQRRKRKKEKKRGRYGTAQVWKLGKEYRRERTKQERDMSNSSIARPGHDSLHLPSPPVPHTPYAAHFHNRNVPVSRTKHIYISTATHVSASTPYNSPSMVPKSACYISFLTLSIE